MKSTVFRKSKSVGVGLVEILIVVAVIVAFLAVGIPLLSKTVRNTQLKNAAQTLVDDLRDYQQRTMTEQKEGYFSFYKDEGTNRHYEINFNGQPILRDLPNGIEVGNFDCLSNKDNVPYPDYTITQQSPCPMGGDNSSFFQVYFDPKGGIKGFSQEGRVFLKLTGDSQPVIIVSIKPSGLVTFTYQ